MKGLLGLSLLLVVGGATADVPAATTAPRPDVASPPRYRCAEIKEFKDTLHKLINAALRYPQALLYRPVTGVTSVAYKYRDGHVLDVRIIMASGDPILDRSALNAVKNADYASVANVLVGQTLHDVVIVVYDNTGEVDQAEQENRARKGQQKQADQDCTP